MQVRSGGSLQLEEAGGTRIFDSFEIPPTGGWNSWTTVRRKVYLPGGNLNFGVKALRGGWNFHWFSLSTDGSKKPVVVAPTERRARLTHFTSYPAPNSDECRDYNGCHWAGWFAGLSERMSPEWVAAHNIAAVHSDDFERYKLKTLRISTNSKSIDVKVYDMCSDNDCNGCCTRNRGNTGFLIDLEIHTANRLGTYDGEISWKCIDC